MDVCLTISNGKPPIIVPSQPHETPLLEEKPPVVNIIPSMVPCSNEKPTIGSVLVLGQPNEHESLSRLGWSRQIRAACFASMPSLSLGTTLGYSAVALPQLQDKNSDITITEEQASWIASLPALSISVGCVLSGVLMERLGRKATLRYQSIPCIAGWFLIFFFSRITINFLYLGRLLTGLGGGMVDAACQVYIGEMSSPQARGFLAAIPSLAFALGVLLVYVLGCVHMKWCYIAVTCGFIAMAPLMLLREVPESPVWLASRGENSKARKAVFWFKGCTGHQNTALGLSFLQSGCIVQPKPTLRDALNSFLSPSTKRPLCIIIVFFFFQQFCGMNAVIFYAVKMFQQDTQDGSVLLNEHYSAVIIGATRFVMTGIGCVLLSRVGRRHMTLTSGVGMTISLCTLSTIMLVQEKPSPNATLVWLVAYIAFNTLGFYTVPWIILGEILPEKCRGLASGLISALVYIFVFIVVKSYPVLLSLMRQDGVFMFFSVISFLGTLFVFFILPETKGKSLVEIERSFNMK